MPVTFDTTSSYGGICGAVYENADVDYTISNCYTLQGKCAKVYGSLEENCPASKINHSFVKDDDAFASGEVCYKLNHGVTDGSQKWYQTLDGTDDFPVLNDSQGTVFFGYDSDVLKYSNTEITVGAIHRNICDATCTVGYTMECWEDTRSRRFYAEEACATELNAAYVVTYSPVKTAPEYDCNLAAWPWKMKDESVTYDGVTFINALEKRYSDAASYYYGEYVWFKVKDTTARNARLKWHLNKNTFDGELYYKINDGNETKIDISGNMWVQDLPDLKQDDIVTVYYRITSMWDISLNSPLIWTMSLEYCSEHNLEHNPATLPTCTENGNYENWYCAKCGTHFKDELYIERWANDNGWIAPKAKKNEIWYTTTDNQQIVHGVSYKANEYQYGLGKIVLADGVTEIAANAFNRNKTIQSIFIPSSVKKIGDSSFWECINLNSISITEGMTFIDKYAFGKTPIQSILIPSTVQTIATGVFNECTQLQSIAFHSLPKVNSGFQNCNISTKILDLTDSDKPYIGTSLDNYPSGGFTEARYHRTLEPGKWGTIVLPFAPTDGMDGLEFYKLKEMALRQTQGEPGNGGSLVFTKVGAPQDGVPYLVRNVSDSKTEFILTKVDTNIILTPQNQTAGDFTLKGSFQQKQLNGAENGNLYYLKDDQFYHANGKINIAPFRAYIEGNGASSAKSFMLIVEDDGEIDAIPGILTDGSIDEMEAIYDLNGRRLTTPVKGQVNIIRTKSGKTIKVNFANRAQ